MKLVLIGGYLLALAALLSLALNQAILLTGLYQASLSTDPAPEWQRLSFGRELFGLVIITSVRNLTTFYEKPVSPAFVLMQPVPQQIATVAVALENDRTMWLNLKMSYRPFLGTRYLCGENVN